MLNENGIKVHAIINDIKKSERISNEGTKKIKKKKYEE